VTKNFWKLYALAMFALVVSIFAVAVEHHILYFVSAMSALIAGALIYFID